MGRELTDDARKFRMATKDRHAGVKAYCHRARSAFFGEDRPRRLTLTDLLNHLAEVERKTVRFWSKQIAQLERQFFASILDRIPDGWISEAAAEFALEVLVNNQQYLRELTSGN